MAGRTDAAVAQWNIALQQVQEGPKSNPQDLRLLAADSLLLADLGKNEESEREFLVYQRFSPSTVWSGDDFDYKKESIFLKLGRKDEVLKDFAKEFRAEAPFWEFVHANARLSLLYDSIRGKPGFEKLLRENMPKYAKPFDDQVAK
jgi:hypothetical protein